MKMLTKATLMMMINSIKPKITVIEIIMFKECNIHLGKS